jgi:hypothetical protein
VPSGDDETTLVEAGALSPTPMVGTDANSTDTK